MIPSQLTGDIANTIQYRMKSMNMPISLGDETFIFFLSKVTIFDNKFFVHRSLFHCRMICIPSPPFHKTRSNFEPQGALRSSYLNIRMQKEKLSADYVSVNDTTRTPTAWSVLITLLSISILSHSESVGRRFLTASCPGHSPYSSNWLFPL